MYPFFKGDYLKNVNKLKIIIPIIPLILVFILLLLKPSYLFSVGGDTNFHLTRAREILENPLYGLFWDNLTCYPIGRPVWHQPLFHVVYAFVWFLGGVRFAHSFMCIIQVLLTVGVASWIANKEYGVTAGFFAGFFALFGPLQSTLIVAVPATYIPIFAVLTIYYIPRDKKKAFIASFAGLWTHMVALATFIPLYLVDNYHDKTNLKIIALLIPSWLFWVGYWIYFSDRLVTGGAFYSLKHLYLSIPLTFTGLYGVFFIYTMGIIGLYLLYKINNKQFKSYLTYMLLIISFSFFGFGGDFLRGFQFAALPMAILSGLTVQKIYDYISKNYKAIVSAVFIFMFLSLSLLGVAIFFGEFPEQDEGWNAINYPFEGKYAPITEYIEHNTNETDVVWAQPDVAEKIAWMTGRKVSNGLYQGNQYGATKGFVETHQNINIYKTDGYFLVNNFNNQTVERIKMLNK